MPYLEFARAMHDADLILTDSGGVQEEAPYFGIPVLVMRETSERMEGVEAGCLKLVGTQTESIVREATAVLDVPARVKDAVTANPDIVVSLTADPKVTAQGVVREVAPRADPVTGTFRVRIRLINPPAAMRLGTTVSGRINLPAAATAAIEIPPSAVTRSDRQASVWVVDPKTGIVASRAIEIRASDPTRIEVSYGLVPGDVVVTAGVHALRSGQKVRLLETKQ
jgi:RND family efflux transporter MFP subunit